MIYVPRDTQDPREKALIADALARLVEPYPDGFTELQRARTYYTATPAPTRSYDKFQRYGEQAVRLAIDAVFKRKCAFCESNYSAVRVRNIEHFRPKGGVEDHGPHPGYWWLAADWTNLLASCIPCNQRGKHSHYTPDVGLADYNKILDRRPADNSGKANWFPVAGNNWVMVEGVDLGVEDPLLINPCKVDPALHLEWGFNWDQSQPIWEAPMVIAFLKPRETGGVPSAHGEASIRIFGLNRSGLMRERESRVKLLQMISKRGVERIANAPAIDRNARVGDVFQELSDLTSPEQTYTGLAKAYIELFPRQLAKFLPQL